MRNAYSYVERWEQIRAGNYGVILWGGVGTGKSCIARYIVNVLMEKENSVYMTNLASTLNDLAASYRDRNEYIASLCSFRLLIFDDFGMKHGTEYGLEQVYNVIDSRYRSGKPLIVTTTSRWENYIIRRTPSTPAFMAALLKCVPPVCIAGENFRKAKARE